MGNLNLNLSGIQGWNSESQYDPIPPGLYPVTVIDAVVTSSKAGRPMVKVTLEVSGGDFMRRKLFDQFVLDHEVGLRRLKNLAIAIGHPTPDTISDTSELMNRSCVANVAVEDDAGYGPRNRIKTYKAQPKPTPASQAQQAPFAAPTPAAQPKRKMPWDN